MSVVQFPPEKELLAFLENNPSTKSKGISSAGDIIRRAVAKAFGGQPKYHEGVQMGLQLLVLMLDLKDKVTFHCNSEGVVAKIFYKALSDEPTGKKIEIEEKKE